MNPTLSAAAEFGFSRPSFGSDSTGAQPASALPAVEAALPGERFWNHPSFALAAVVAITAVALGHSTRPILGAKASGNVGPATGSIEGSV